MTGAGKDLAFLNADINMRLSPERWLYMRKQQIKWTNAQVRACLFLSLNRAEGFGGTRIQRLTEQMDAVQQEYSCNVPGHDQGLQVDHGCAAT